MLEQHSISRYHHSKASFELIDFQDCQKRLCTNLSRKTEKSFRKNFRLHYFKLHYFCKKKTTLLWFHSAFSLWKFIVFENKGKKTTQHIQLQLQSRRCRSPNHASFPKETQTLLKNVKEANCSSTTPWQLTVWAFLRRFCRNLNFNKIFFFCFATSSTFWIFNCCF